MKKCLFLVLAVVTAHFALQTYADSDLTVVDGDSLEIAAKRIRLVGIDAPEYFQTCEDNQGREYMCGQEAKAYLEKLIEKGRRNGKKVKCMAQGSDRYKRDLSVCYIGDTELNFEMVKSGYALSYKSDKYALAEKRAKKRGKGLWQGKFMRPEIYRAIKREQEKQKNS